MRIFASLAASVACSFMACGSSSPSDGDPLSPDSGGVGVNDVPDPCAFLSIAEVQPVVKNVIVTAEPGPGSFVGDRACTWRAADGAVMNITAQIPKESFKPLASSDRSISGLGDQAYTSFLGAIFVKVGQKQFMSESLVYVADGVVGPEVTAALSDVQGADLPKYEASFRLGKLFAAKLR